MAGSFSNYLHIQDSFFSCLSLYAAFDFVNEFGFFMASETVCVRKRERERVREGERKRKKRKERKRRGECMKENEKRRDKQSENIQKHMYKDKDYIDSRNGFM